MPFLLPAIASVTADNPIECRELQITSEDRRILQRHVDRLCPRWLYGEREDLAQMAAVKLLRGNHTVSTSRSGLLRSVAYSVIVDEIRYRKRRNEQGMSPSMPNRSRSREIDPETRAYGSELALLVTECLETLEPDRRRAVTLYLQTHRVPEIAAMLQWDRKKASNLVYRGLSDLRAALRSRGLTLRHSAA